MKRTMVAITLILLCLPPVAAQAKSIGVGDVEFKVFFSGVNDFAINDFTGPLFGLPPDFPVADNLMFNGAVLKLTQSDGTVDVVNLGDVTPGILDGNVNPSLLFPDTTSFSMANLTATLSQNSFLLSDGTTFLADPKISLTLKPPVGTLVADVDLGVLSAEPVPEPATLILLGSGLAGILTRKRKRVC